MKPLFPRFAFAFFFFVAGWLGFYLYQKSVAGISEKSKGPSIETDQHPSIVGLEVPIRSKNGRSQDALLKAAYADQISETELRVYGGFEYRTPDKIITGEEAVINMATGTTRQMKGIKIWEK